MAIQNFLSGGFYGSIGKLTGRRWKNKRVVQAKFKPANPRTPAQQKQRELFTRGSALAKIAQQVNWKAPQFENPIRTDWNQRQTIAINALKNGESEWEALPLAPNDFEAQHIIGTCTLDSVSDDNMLNVTFEGTNLLANKKYACALFFTSGKDKDQIIVGSTPTASTDALKASFRLPVAADISGNDVYIKIASIDDTTTDTVTLSAGILLQQAKEIPYVFNPSLVSVIYDNENTIRIAVKLGDEPIESYDPFLNTSILLYDKVWTKETAVKNDKLDTDNWQDISQQLSVTRTTVAKSTATVTFACSFTEAYKYEKYAAKLDIKINASNIKGASTVENTETLSLSAQSFPEYLQPICNIPSPQNLYIKANVNKKLNGEWTMTGTAYAKNEQSQSGQMIYISQDWESYDEDYSEVTVVTTQAGQNLSGDDLDEVFGEYGVSYEIVGNEIGWYIPEHEIKNFTGTLNTQTLFPNGKIAFYGYRVLEIPKDADGDQIISTSFVN